ncbi:MAG: hypothetical protein OSB38_31700, partial [Paraburkholderia fungorum]|nr:hypothetical protein [Paraburkholderia fungorum]
MKLFPLLFSGSIVPLILGLVAATGIGLTACSSGSNSDSSSGSPGSSASATLQTQADLGCTPVAGPLDPLQNVLSSTLTSGLQGLPDTGAIAGKLVTLVDSALDLVDSIAQTARALNPKATGANPALLTAVLNQALCTTAAAGETLLALTITGTASVAD